MKTFSEILIAAVGAFFISGLFEDTGMVFTVIFIILYSVIQLITGKRKMEFPVKKSKKAYICLGIACLLGIAGTAINYFILENTWLGVIFAMIFAASFSVMVTIGISFLLEYIVNKKNISEEK